MELLSFDASERMVQFEWSPVQYKGKQPAREEAENEC